MSVGFFGLFRSGELVIPSDFDPSWNLSRSSVSFYPSIINPVRVDIDLPSSKTDPFRIGVLVSIGTAHPSGPCAVHLLRRLFLTFPLPPNKPLFSLPSGIFSKSFFINTIRQILPRIGLNPADFAGHSFRIGGATAASSLGMSEYEIKVLGRWRSDAYLAYLRIPLTQRANLAARLSQPPKI